MLVQGKHFRTIWLKEGDHGKIQIIDQRFLPHKFVIEDLKNTADVINAIQEMHVRGAGLIGATAGYGMYLGTMEAAESLDFDLTLNKIAKELKSSRPTAVNLEWAVNRQLTAINEGRSIEEKIDISKRTAELIADEDSNYCKSIGQNGLKLIQEISDRKSIAQVNILTHCNAGWLAFTDYGSATAPIYKAFDQGIDIHVWVDETRPRNQGASLTAWELLNYGVPHTVIPDNTGGHLMQNNKVDIVITGADRVTRTGDVANKIGTYLKALAARDNQIPFYVAIPSSTIDWNIVDGHSEIPIEQRGGDEVRFIYGMNGDELQKVRITPEKSPVANYGFDITPSGLVSGFITERGICEASQKGLLHLFPERNTFK